MGEHGNSIQQAREKLILLVQPTTSCLNRKDEHKGHYSLRGSTYDIISEPDSTKLDGVPRGNSVVDHSRCGQPMGEELLRWTFSISGEYLRAGGEPRFAPQKVMIQKTKNQLNKIPNNPGLEATITPFYVPQGTPHRKKVQISYKSQPYFLAPTPSLLHYRRVVKDL